MHKLIRYSQNQDAIPFFLFEKCWPTSSSLQQVNEMFIVGRRLQKRSPVERLDSRKKNFHPIVINYDILKNVHFDSDL